MLKFLINKKGMSPVVSTALLLVVAVASVGIFQGWFQTYSSGLFSGIEQDSSVDVMNTRIDTILGNNLYFKNDYNNLTITEIKLNDVSCIIDKSYGQGMQIINISDCVETDQSTAEVVVVTNRGLFTKTLFVHGDGSSSEEVYSSCTLDSITRDHGDNNTFYNTSSVPFGDSCSSISRTCNNGTFDGDTSYNYSNCSVDAQDTMPDAFNFTDQTDVELDTLIESNTLTPTDYDGPLSVGITGDGTPELSVNGGGYTTSTTMDPEDNLTIRLNSSSSYNITSQVNLTLGDYSTIWSVKTKFGEECTLDSITRDHGESYSFYNSRSVPFGDSCSSISRTCNNGTFDGDTSYNYSNCSVDAQDTMPDAFNFNDEVDVELDTLIESNTLTPTDYDGPLSVGITGDGSPQISIDDGSSWTTSDDMNPGDTLAIRLTSSSNYNTTSQANLTLGDYSTIWSVKTKEEVILSSSLICDTDADENTFISYACGDYPMTDTTLEGHLDPDDNEILVEPDVNCVWKDDKSGCVDNFVIDGCGSGTVLDTGSGLCWQRDFGVGTRNWEEAKSLCDGLSLAGHTDWYLPLYNELLTIVDLSRSDPVVVGGNNKFSNVQSAYYWTKTTYGPYIGDAWIVGFYRGDSYSIDKTGGSNVACVRRN